MLVSHAHEFIFLKTRKTAGTSVEDYFIPYCVEPHGTSRKTFNESAYVSSYGIVGKKGKKPEPGELQFWNHMPAKLLRDSLDRNAWDNYFKFSSVRNPFEKVISMYFFRKHREQSDPSDPEREREEFNAWCIDSGPPVDRRIYVIEEEFVLDDVVRVESIEADMARICSRLNIPWSEKLLRKAKSGIRPAWATATYMYGQESRAAVERAFDFEMEYFGYAFPA